MAVRARVRRCGRCRLGHRLDAGKSFDGEKLLALFGALMIVIAVLMLSKGSEDSDTSVRLTRDTAPRLAPSPMPAKLMKRESPRT